MKEFFTELEKQGADIKEGLGRLMGNEGLYEKLLAKFPASAEDEDIRKAMDKKDYNELLELTHKLKGVTGNLSLTPLYERYTTIVSDIRAKNYDGMDKKIEEVLKLQKEFCKTINHYLNP
jgi:HPt (histidine-containing phosphotransfer) domain-containing protein